MCARVWVTVLCSFTMHTHSHIEIMSITFVFRRIIKPKAVIGDAGLVALAPALRRLPALERLDLYNNPFGDEGLAALVAPPPPAGAPPTTTGGLAQLKVLDLDHTQITDAGCATLAAALDSGALPALKNLYMDVIPASAAATAAVYKARTNLSDAI